MLVFACLFALALNVRAQVPTVVTLQGEVQGTQVTDGNYFGYYGLHYGGSTAGENRFKAPTPAPNYPGLYHAMDASVMCAQPSPRGLTGQEDCLTLNVFTNNTSASRPVIVWLNGEEYTSTYSGPTSFKRFIEEGLVIVAINYRLSVFGFLCLGVPEAPGNAGLKDVVQGLQWIQSNIAGFGGNPNNVILLGHGSGAAMVDLITTSPKSQNLVHKAIALSGSGIAPWAVAYNPVGHAQILGASLGYAGKSNQELAKLLQTTDVSVLMNSLRNIVQFYNNTALFAPCIENSEFNDTLLIDTPLNILRSGNFNHIPYIVGYTNQEGTIRAEEAMYEEWLPKMQGNFSFFLPVDIDFETNRTVERTIREFYFGNRNVDMDTIQDFISFHGDTLILVSTIRGARERALTSKAEVRLMEFAYRGTANSDWSFPQIPLIGVKHGGILNFLFDFDLNPNDQPVRQLLMKRLSTFAYTGVPTGVVGARIANWPSITNATFNYLYYGGESGPLVNLNNIFVEEDREYPHQNRMNFWNDIYFKYYKPPPSSSAIVCSSLVVLLLSCMLSMKF